MKFIGHLSGLFLPVSAFAGLWISLGFPTSSDCELTLMGRPAPAKYVDAIPLESRQNSKSKSGKDRTKVFEPKVINSDDPNVLYGGDRYRGFRIEQLPQTGIPIIRSISKHSPNIRLVLTPGIGATTSHSGSTLRFAALIQRLFVEKDPSDQLSGWLRRQNPHLLKLRVEVIAIDTPGIPGTGWGPALNSFGSATDVSKYIASAVTDMHQSWGYQKTVIGCRSASCPLAAVATNFSEIAGVFMGSGTFPDPDILAENRADIQFHVDQGDYQVDWPTVDLMIEMLKDDGFSHLHERAFIRSTPIVSLVGSQDEQTSIRAQDLWQQRLQMAWQMGERHRDQLVLNDLGHFVFPSGIPTNANGVDERSVEARALIYFAEFLRTVAQHDPVKFRTESVESLSKSVR